ncbi:MAG: FCD domain-containing protein [Candidatus Sulfotelmatobacter sp.]|jgi:DNA-binding FadR family transcriptional regulator
MPQNKSQDLECAILQTLHSSRQPMGSWSLYYLLREQGHGASAPTIGRKLRELEQRKLLGKSTVEGRIITPAGERMLRKAMNDEQVRARADKLLKALDGRTQKDIIDLLTVRRIIEVESAGLAALHASRVSITKLEEIVRKQRQAIKKGRLGVGEDVGFHEALAQISGNKILSTTVHLLRSQEWMNYVVTEIRAKVGSRLAVDHQKIILALKTRNVSLARRAMEQHLNELIADVERYGKLVVRRKSPA